MNSSKREKKDSPSRRRTHRTKKTQDSSRLYAILEPLAPSDTMSQMFERVIERVLQATGADAALIRVLDKESGRLACAVQRGFPEPYLKAAYALSPASGSGRVFTTGKPILSREIASDSRLKGKVQMAVGFHSCAILPLQVSKKVRGIIHLASYRTGYFTEQQREQLMAVARQMAIALENWELLDQSERRARELAALNTVAAAVSSSLDLDVVLLRALDAVLESTGMEAGYIQFVDPSLQQLTLRVHRGISPVLADRLKGEIRGGGKSAQIIASKRSLVLDDIPLDCPGKFKGQGIRAAVLVPILSRDRVIGILTVTTRRMAIFPRDKIALLELIASSLGVATENALFFKEVDRRRKYAEVLREIGLSLTGTHDAQQVLEQVAEEARRLIGALFTFVVIPDTPFYQIAAVAGDDQGYRSVLKLSDDPASTYGRGPLGQAIRSRTSVICEDVLTDPLFVPWREIASARGIRSLVAVPLLGPEKTYGALLTYSPVPRAYDTETLDLLSSLAAQAAAALENARLFKETEKRATELAALIEINQNVATLLDREVLLPRIAEQARKILRVDSSIFRLLEGEKLILMGASDPQNLSFRPSLGLTDSLSGKIVRENRPLAIKNVREDTTILEEHREIIQKAGYHSFLGVPLRVGERRIGVLNFYSREERDFQTEEISLITAFADQAAVAVENANLYQQSRKREEIQKLLKELSLDITSLDIDSLFKKLTEQVRKILKVDVSDVQVIEAGLWQLIGVSGMEPEQLRSKSKGTGRGRSKWIIENRKPLAIPDIAQAADSPSGESLLRAGIRGYLAVPLFSRDGEVIGTLRALSFQPRGFTDDEVDFLQQLGNGAAIALQNARLFKETEKRARELAALHAVMSTVSGSIELDDVLERALHAIILVTGMESGRIRLLEGEPPRLVLKAHKGVPPEHIERLQRGTRIGGRSEQVLVSKQPLVLESRGGPEPPGQRPSETLREGFAAAAWIPILLKDSVVGIINLASRETGTFLRDQIPLLEAIGASLGVAIENATLYQESKRQEETQKLIKELSQDITSLDINALFQKVTDKVREFFKVEISDIRLLEEGGVRRLVGSSGIESERLYKLGKSRGRSGWIVKNRRPLAIPDITKETTIPTGDTTRELGIRGYLAVPLFSKGGEVIGILRALTYEPRDFSQAEIDLLQQLANGTAIAIENARLFREAELRAQEQAALNSIAMAVNQSLHLDELLQISLNKVLDVTGRDAGYIRLKERATGALRLAAHRGIAQDYVDTLLHHRTPGGKSERVFQSGEPLVVNDPEGTVLREETRQQGNQSIAWIPLKARGKVVGILNVSTNRPVPFADREVHLLMAIGNMIGVALENAQLFEDSERLVRELEETTQQLGLKNKELDSFVYTVSHDLKAPLISLEGMAALLLDEYAGKLDEGAQHYLKRLMASSKQMEALILDLLALSRIGREGRSSEGVSLNQVVEELLLEWGQTIRAGNIQVTRHELPTLWGVRTQIQQVMTNLLSNAVKYLGASPDPAIEIGAKEDGGKMVECYVKDNGIGIDPQYHEKVFETFQRLKEIETEGTGVGLAIVKKIIEGAGGRVWVESAKGEGATFHFTWPKTQGEVKP